MVDATEGQCQLNGGVGSKLSDGDAHPGEALVGNGRPRFAQQVTSGAMDDLGGGRCLRQGPAASGGLEVAEPEPQHNGTADPLAAAESSGNSIGDIE